jgi:hypothetical protein
MWVLVLLAIKINDPQDVPGRVTVEFPTEEACKSSARSMVYWLKFDRFKVTAHCERKK